MSSSSEEKKKKKSRLRGLFSRKSSGKKAAKQERKASIKELQEAEERRNTMAMQPNPMRAGRVEPTHQDPEQDLKKAQEKARQKFQKDFVKKYMMSGEAYSSFVEYDQYTDYSKRSIKPNEEFVELSEEASIKLYKIPSQAEVTQLLESDLFSDKEREALKHNQLEMQEKLRNPNYEPNLQEFGQTQQIQEAGGPPPIPTSARPRAAGQGQLPPTPGAGPPPIPTSARPNQRGTSPSPSDGGYGSADGADPYAQVGGAGDSAGAYAPVGDGSGTSPDVGEYVEARSFERHPLRFSKGKKEVKILPPEQHMEIFNLSFYGDDIPIGKILYQNPPLVIENIKNFHKAYTENRDIVGDLKKDSFTIDHAYQVYSDYLFSEKFSKDYESKGSYAKRMQESIDPLSELKAIASEAGIPEDKIEILRKSFNNSPRIPLEYRVFDKETSLRAEELLKSPKFKAEINNKSKELYNDYSKQWVRLMELDEKGCQKYAKARALESEEIKKNFKIESGISDYLKLKFDDKEPRILGETQRLGNAAPQLSPKRGQSSPQVVEVETYAVLEGQNTQAGISASAPPAVDDTSGRPVTGVDGSLYADIDHGVNPADLQRSASAPVRGASSGGEGGAAGPKAPPRPPKSQDPQIENPLGTVTKAMQKAGRRRPAAAQRSASGPTAGAGSGGATDQAPPPRPPKPSQAQRSASAPVVGADSGGAADQAPPPRPPKRSTSAPAVGAGSADDGPPLPKKLTPPRPPKPQDPQIENPLGTVTKAMQAAAQRSASAPAAGAGRSGDGPPVPPKAGPKAPPRPPKPQEHSVGDSGDDGPPVPKKQKELDKANIEQAREDANKRGHDYQNLRQLQEEVNAIKGKLIKRPPPPPPKRTQQSRGSGTVTLQGRKGGGPEFNA